MASHWASADAPPLTKDLPPPSAAPRAGGSTLKPDVNLDWEWELSTVVKPSGIASAPKSRSIPTTHKGGCHCGAVRFECTTPTSDVVVWECNCSDCRMRRNLHLVVPQEGLKITSKGGAANLPEYRWGTGTARHLFCATCGISPFYKPRSNPDGWGITLPCVDGGTVSSVEIRRFDGLNWEECIVGSGSSIKGFSKERETDEPGESQVSGEAAITRPIASLVLCWCEVVATFLLPFILVMLISYNSGKMPGKPQADIP